jgi:serine/threonine-protein kinase SRPK3
MDHPGRSAVRLLLDSFNVNGPNRQYQCLVHPPLWESILDFRHRNPVRRLPEPVIAFVLQRLFLALDLLHKECHVAHTDIKEANILLGTDKSVLRAFEKEELNKPCPRKELDGRTIYLSRELSTLTDFGAPVLCDFGSAVQLDGAERREDIQPNIYRAPEVILDIPWTCSVDIWNVGCMVSVNSLNKRPLADPSIRRSGTPSRGSTYSLATILRSRRTGAGFILLR